MPGAISSGGHLGELASKSAAGERQHTQVNMATPVMLIVKTVASKVIEKTDYVTAHTGLEVTQMGDTLSVHKRTCLAAVPYPMGRQAKN